MIMYVNWSVCHVISGSWINNSGYGAEFPGMPDGLATRSVMSSYMISCVDGEGCAMQTVYCGPLYKTQL